MSEQQNTIVPTDDQGDWKPQVYMLGGLIGAALGLISAFLYVRTAEEKHGGNAPESPGTRDAMRVGMSLLTIIRTITEWGNR